MTEESGLFMVPAQVAYPPAEPDLFLERLIQAMTEPITDDTPPTTTLGCFR